MHALRDNRAHARSSKDGSIMLFLVQSPAVKVPQYSVRVRGGIMMPDELLRSPEGGEGGGGGGGALN